MEQLIILVLALLAGASLAWGATRERKGSRTPEEQRRPRPEPIPNPATELTEEIHDAEDEIQSLPDGDLADAWADHADRSGD